MSSPSPVPIAGVHVTRKGAGRVESGHPWIFSSDVADRGAAEPGAAVRVVDPRNRFLGIAHYSSTSQITLRLLTPKQEPVDREFFLRRIARAAEHRRRIVSNSDAYRLIFSEADLLPGLIVDRYAGHLVAQTLDQGMDRAWPLLLDCLREVMQPESILLRNDAAVRRHENLPLEVTVAHGTPPERVAVALNGVKFDADLLHGQKTGVYLDQRENYAAVARYARGRALDCFTSTGGFAIHMSPRCESVLALDSSESALTSARRNAEQNGAGNIDFREADVLDFLAQRWQSSERFATIVLDPPAFTKTRAGLDGAARGYKEINLRALRMLEPGGTLVTCSCSHHMSEAMLLETIASAALDAGRTLRILERRTQSADHPILLTVPETLYLKCLIFEVLS